MSGSGMMSGLRSRLAARVPLKITLVAAASRAGASLAVKTVCHRPRWATSPARPIGLFAGRERGMPLDEMKGLRVRRDIGMGQVVR